MKHNHVLIDYDRRQFYLCHLCKQWLKFLPKLSSLKSPHKLNQTNGMFCHRLRLCRFCRLHQFQGEKLNIPQGMTKEAYLEYQLNIAITESQGLDLVTMGRGEGPECYCYPNVVIRKLIDDWAKNYSFVVMDNEAGMEHLSRRTTQNIDELLLVTDHSVKGLRAVARIRDLVAELKLVVKRESVIINLVPDEIDPLLKEEMERLGITAAATIPVDDEVKRYDLEQKPLFDLPDSSAAARAVNELMDKLLSKTGVAI